MTSTVAVKGSIVADTSMPATKFCVRGANSTLQLPDADDLETYEMLTLSKDELVDALKSGRFKVMAWAAGIGLALLNIED